MEVEQACCSVQSVHDGSNVGGRLAMYVCLYGVGSAREFTVIHSK